MSRYSILIECLWTAFLIGYGLGFSDHATRELPFLERDPNFSFPAPLKAAIPTWLLVVLAIILPGAILLVLPFITAAARKLQVPWRSSLKVAAYLLLGLAQSVGVEVAAVDTLKNVVGRPRPGFFSLCNYAGYRDALAAGDLTPYLAATDPNAFADISKCLDKPAIDDALRSFPSGHAGISFCGLLYLTLALRWAAGVSPKEHFSARAAVCAAPCILAAYISVTRISDFKHATVDISVGALIGILGACLAWLQFNADAARAGALQQPARLPEPVDAEEKSTLAATPVQLTVVQ